MTLQELLDDIDPILLKRGLDLSAVKVQIYQGAERECDVAHYSYVGATLFGDTLQVEIKIED